MATIFGSMRRMCSVTSLMARTQVVSRSFYSMQCATTSVRSVFAPLLVPQSIRCSTITEEFAGNELEMVLDSVMRKRKLKMKKHKLRKRRKRQKAEKRKQSQGN